MQYHMHLTRLICHINDKSTSRFCMCVCVCKLSNVQLFVTPWMVACQDPLSMGFFKQEYWNGLPFTPPGDLPYPRICIAGGYFTTEPQGRHSISNGKLVKNKEQCYHTTHNPSKLICLHHRLHVKGYILLGSLISPTLQIEGLKRRG